jgi:hypothetical protein
MIKSGLIVGVITLFLALGITLILPFCVPCLALLVGLAAGYLAGVIDKPGIRPDALKHGAIAGALAGAGGLLGEIIGAVINGLMIGPANAVDVIRSLGLPSVPTLTPQMYWVSNIGVNACVGLFSVAVMAALGVVGGMIWWGSHNSQNSVIPPMDRQ